MNAINISKIAGCKFAILLICVLLAACGRGGGGGSGGSGDGSGSTIPATYSITGTVSGAALSGVTISLTGPTSGSTTTDAGGSYSFASLANGSYTVTPSKLGYTFNPTNSTVSVNNANVSGTNFAAAGQINDTGITPSQCYQAGSDALVPCSSVEALALNSAQDGMVGRDANSATNSNADGKLGFSFSAVTGGCVLDNVTGLMWEGSPTSATFTNKGDNSAGDASTDVAAVNTNNLCGHNDWRMPSINELQSILDYGVAVTLVNNVVHIDSTWFPNTLFDFSYWTLHSGSDPYAWIMDFASGYTTIGSPENTAGYVRLVRGVAVSAQRFVLSADGSEVTDQHTGLIWRRCSEGMNWNGTNCDGTASPYTHEAALLRAANQAGSVAWRLPNIKELHSLADQTLSNPAINTTFFPATSSYYWSSSPYIYSAMTAAWIVNFSDGAITTDDRMSSNFVQLVRDGL
jgi:hypothetical protein